MPASTGSIWRAFDEYLCGCPNTPKRILNKASYIATLLPDVQPKEWQELISMIGYADLKEAYPYLLEGLNSDNQEVKIAAIHAASHTFNPLFLDNILSLLLEKKLRKDATTAILHYGKGVIALLYEKVLSGKLDNRVSRLIPNVIAKFKTQAAVNCLLNMLTQAEDLTVRLECIRSLTALKSENDLLQFNRNLVAKIILSECKLYSRTLDAMHTQIIVHYMRRKKDRQISAEETNARESLMELLEGRLDAGLERIFKLLELKYSPIEEQTAYKGVLSEKQEQQTNAVEFLDSILNPSLRSVLIPIIETSMLDSSSEEITERIQRNRLQCDCQI